MKDMPYILAMVRMAVVSLIVGLGCSYSQDVIPDSAEDVIVYWSGWSGCSAPCGGGFQTRVRLRILDPGNAGSKEKTLSPTIRTCNPQTCECKIKLFKQALSFTFLIKSNLQDASRLIAD